MLFEKQPSLSTPSANGTDGGGAVAEKWYVAYVRPNCERRVAQDINKLNYTTYVATQKVMRQWSDRRKLIDKVVITQVVFIKCTKKDTERLERHSIIYYFLRIPGTREKAEISDKELDNLMKVLDGADLEDVDFVANKFSKGDTICIRFGKFAGVTGVVEHEANGAQYLTVRINYLGSARVRILEADLKLIEVAKKS